LRSPRSGTAGPPSDSGGTLIAEHRRHGGPSTAATWAMTDPAAGAWFNQQALQLAQNATPPLF
jgi:hypothetical protein